MKHFPTLPIIRVKGKNTFFSYQMSKNKAYNVSVGKDTQKQAVCEKMN